MEFGADWYLSLNVYDTLTLLRSFTKRELCCNVVLQAWRADQARVELQSQALLGVSNVDFTNACVEMIAVLLPYCQTNAALGLY